ncbi:MAG: DNA mismatch repair protein MutS, partial [Bacteroidetes bacterium]
MFRQYRALKEQVPDAILFFRMGDFYELFFDDARVAAELLDLTLTSRNRGAPDEIPMAGVPHHAARGYVRTLVDRGYKVAIADQVEDPKAARGLVRRAITQVVTPGMVLDPEDLAPAEPCWLGALAVVGRRVGLALLDASTGAFRVAEVADLSTAVEELGRAGAREVLLPERLRDAPELAALDAARTVPEDLSWDPARCRERLQERFRVATLAGFGLADRPLAIRAAGAIVQYARETQQGTVANLRAIRVYTPG